MNYLGVDEAITLVVEFTLLVIVTPTSIVSIELVVMLCMCRNRKELTMF